jgi:hypothetical protein
MRHIVVCNPAGAVLATVAGKRCVVLGQFRVLGDDVPCVQEPWHESEEAKSDVDQRVGTAETALDPDWGNGCQLEFGWVWGAVTGDGREEDGDQPEEYVAGAHRVGSFERKGTKAGPPFDGNRWFDSPYAVGVCFEGWRARI